MSDGRRRGARIAVDVTADGVRVPLSGAAVAAAAAAVLRAEGVRDAMLSIAFLDDRAMAALNRRHLGHAGATDVISFGFDSSAAPAAPVVGDIYVAPNIARKNAHAYHTGVREEILRLVVHGVLHVLGHDHPEGEGRLTSPMWERQERHLARVSRLVRRRPR